MAGDVYARPPHAGRGGWSWYTGSAGWMYRAGLESILGLRGAARRSASTPASPRRGPSTRSAWRFQSSRYEISVSIPTHQCRGVVEATLDGEAVDAAAIPLVDDGRTHEVRVVMGSAS